MQKNVFFLVLLIFLSAFMTPVFSQEQDVAEVYVTVLLVTSEGVKEHLDETRFDLTVMEEDDKPLPGDSQIYMQYLGGDAQNPQLNVKIRQADNEVVNTNFSLSPGGSHEVKGPAYQNGRLVLLFRTTLNAPDG